MTENDLRIACARAMWLEVRVVGPTAAVNDTWVMVVDGDGRGQYYDPLTDDEQAMALVKKFCLSLGTDMNGDWCVICAPPGGAPGIVARNKDLNRAIVECVAQLPPNLLRPIN